MDLLEDFDPRPSDCKGQATANLAAFMQKVKGRNLGVSLLLDPSTQAWTEETTETPTIVLTEQLLKSVAAFKESLKLPTAKLKEKLETNPNHSLVFCTQIQGYNFILWRDFQAPSNYSSPSFSAPHY